uniref:Glycoside hydrolase family 43 protein n=1 Tax=Roseihalotalea indica TaxID=2867963 RepID=A0AA49GJN2_9BACT|nr:glycoside hydrolase family 43 protein [Tunicatimonas sp. TK19036]
MLQAVYSFRQNIVLLLVVWLCQSAFVQAQSTFTNPLMDGADPWVTRKDGYYYYLHTTGRNLTIWKTKDLSELPTATHKVVWEPPAQGANSESIWAPELHYLDGKWYLYYTATDQEDPGDHNRYVFVLENKSTDPLQGKWVDRGKVNTQYSGLDGSVFEYNGKRYFLYSGYVKHQSNLFIAEMVNPWTLSNKQVEIARPTYDWEKYDGREICEGPQFLQGPGNKIFIVYSASACWDDNYALGMLTADATADLLEPTTWQKSSQPVFETSQANQVYGPGHNCFTTSVDGEQDWIVYHAKSVANQACRERNVRVQPFGWKEDNTPDFGEPLPVSTPVPATLK